jgi:undecaprenyl-diphosphatase
VVSQVADTILSLHGWAALAVIFALPALESSAFVGFVFPGEIAVLLGGVLAFQHRVTLVQALLAAIGGAILGDTIGYAVGRRWGDRLLASTLGRFVRPHHVEKAKTYLADRGGKAVFLGRFTAALRVMVPGLAGMSGLSYKRFAVANVIGGTIWAVAFVMLGYGAGESWQQAEDAARRAGLILLALIAGLLVIILVARWISRNQARVQAVIRRQRERPTIDRLVTRYERQLGFLARRVRPEGALGLSLTLGLVAIVVFGVVFGRILGQVLSNETFGIDLHVHDWLIEHRRDYLTTAMRAVSELGGSAVLIPLVLVLGCAWWVWRRSPKVLLVLTGAYGGAFLLALLVKHLVNRPRPPAPDGVGAFAGSAFPSGHATQALAVYGAMGALAAASTTRWPRKVACWTIAFLVTGAVGISRVYLAAHWVTDVIAGFTLGALWLVLLLTASRILVGLRQPRRAVSSEMLSASRM